MLSAVCVYSRTNYEYWFDSQADRPKLGTFDTDSINLQLSTEDLSAGLHYYNIRFVDENGSCSALFRRPFYVQTPVVESKGVGVKLWLDDDTGSASFEPNNHCKIKIEDSDIRVHSINILPVGENGVQGRIKSVLFLASSPLEAEVATYRYWFDDDSINGVVVEHNLPVLSSAIDVSMLDSGMHSFNIQAANYSGLSGHVYTEKFEILSVSGLCNTEITDMEIITVYTISGVCLLKEANIGRLADLRPGLYIVNGVKTILR